MKAQCSSCRSNSILASGSGAAILGASLSGNPWITALCGLLGMAIGFGATRNKGKENG